MPRRHRWEFLLSTPKRVQRRLDRLAQDTLDRFGRRAFPSSIRYPITETDGQRHWTLDAYLASLRWGATDARVRHERQGRCAGCGTEVGVGAYHLSFGHIGTELDDELLLLCPRCHTYLRQQQRVGRRYGGKVQRLSTWITFTKPQLKRTFKHGGIPQAVPSKPAATSAHLKVHGKSSPRMGTGPGEMILLFIDEEPVFLEVMD